MMETLPSQVMVNLTITPPPATMGGIWGREKTVVNQFTHVKELKSKLRKNEIAAIWYLWTLFVL